MAGMTVRPSKQPRAISARAREDSCADLTSKLWDSWFSGTWSKKTEEFNRRAIALTYGTAARQRSEKSTGNKTFLKSIVLPGLCKEQALRQAVHRADWLKMRTLMGAWQYSRCAVLRHLTHRSAIWPYACS